ncbi:GNAT family N-acetyltransferase [Acidobacteriota bacterium]
MQITIVEESNLSNWENYLKKTSGGPFLSAPWLESFRDSKCTPVYFRFVSEGHTIGLAAGLSLEPPHPLLRKIFRKIFLFSGPAFIQSNPELEKSCVSELINYASSNQFSHFEMRSYDYPHTIDFEDLPFIKEDREEYIIDLNPEWQEIQKNMRKSIIEQKRSAERKGLSFHESQSPEIIDDLVRLLEQTKQRRLTKGYKDYTYYYMPHINKNILHQLYQNKIGRIFHIKHGAKIISILFVVAYRSTVNALLIGSNEDAYNLRAPAFIWFNTIKKLKDEGFQYMNLGGVPKDSSKSKLVFAKKSLGATEHLCSGGKTPHLNGPIYNLLNTLYSKVPDKKIKTILKKSLSGRS